MDCPICKKTIASSDDYEARNMMNDHLLLEHKCSIYDIEAFGKPSYDIAMEGLEELLDGAAQGQKIKFIKGIRRLTMWGLKKSKLFADENMDVVREFLSAKNVGTRSIKQIRLDNARVEALLKEEAQEEWEEEKSKRNRINTLELE